MSGWLLGRIHPMAVLMVCVLALGWSLPAEAKKKAERDAKEKKAESGEAVQPEAAQAGNETPPPTVEGPKGTLDVDVSTTLGLQPPARIEIHDAEDRIVLQLAAPKGKVSGDVPVGDWKAYVYVYEGGVPVLVEAAAIKIAEGKTEVLPVTVVEGSGKKPMLNFDFDKDLALDRVEIACGTDPKNPVSVPGRKPLPYSDRVFAQEPGWYKGDLCVFSKYSIGKESVGDLVKRAERAKLDFLAITDLNNGLSCVDPEFKSDSVVLIPSMSWGSSDLGWARIYGMRILPDWPENNFQAQAECYRVQNQGGAFAAGQPCSPESPWKWGLQYLNAIEIWNGPWLETPALSVDKLDKDLLEKDKEGRYLNSLTAAAAMENKLAATELAINSEKEQEAAEMNQELVKGRVIANGQGVLFWDLELVRGLIAAGTAGSGSTGPNRPLGEPVTYILAENKSLPALVEGLRAGRTFLSESPDGPKVTIGLDVNLKKVLDTNSGQEMDADRAIEIGIGGVAPLNQPVNVVAQAWNAAGKKLQILRNGKMIASKPISERGVTLRIARLDQSRAIYRASVVSMKKGKDDALEVVTHAMTSPVYVQDVKMKMLLDKHEKAVNKEEFAPMAPK